MKPRVVVLLSGITLSAVLAAPIRPAAQEQRQQSDRAGNVGEGATNPVPFVNQPLVPDAVAPGGPEFTLKVNGTGFVSGSVVNWNGSALVTTFVSGSQLTATVPVSDIANASTASVTVVNPSPGGGLSNSIFFPITVSSSAVLFSAPSEYGVGTLTSPGNVTAGDFNGDGKLDLVVVNGGSNTVSILLGNGDGTFQTHVDYATGVNPTWAAVADFNGDGKSDLAVTNCVGGCLGFVSGSVSILLGNGDGTFQTHVDYATAIEPVALAVADFNGDGSLDLAIANYGPAFQNSTIGILLGNGDGTFQPQKTYGAGVNPNGVLVGDFNRDGKLDLAVIDNNGSVGVSILLGNGDGTFQKAVNVAPGIVLSRLGIVADFKSDGNLDLALSNIGIGAGILLGNGDGSFQASVFYPTGAYAQELKGGDFNGDGKLDLVTADYSANSMSLLLGNGDGTFQTHIDYTTGPVPNSVAVGDFNGDGRLDVAFADNGDNTVSILLQGTTVSVSAASLSFPTQLVGTTSAAHPVTLTNTGAVALTISSINASGDFLQTNTCGSSLAAGVSCTINLSFKPSTKGTRTGTLTITDNAAGSPQTVSLTGTGTVVALSPALVNFGTEKVGTTSSPRTITLTNTASTPLNIQAIGIGGTDFGDFADTTTCSSSLAPKASCAITVTFTPAKTGKRGASVKLQDDGGGSPQKVALAGTGT